MTDYLAGSDGYKSNISYESTSSLYKPVKTGPICRRTCCMPPNFKCSCGRN